MRGMDSRIMALSISGMDSRITCKLSTIASKISWLWSSGCFQGSFFVGCGYFDDDDDDDDDDHYEEYSRRGMILLFHIVVPYTLGCLTWRPSPFKPISTSSTALVIHWNPQDFSLLSRKMRWKFAITSEVTPSNPKDAMQWPGFPETNWNVYFRTTKTKPFKFSRETSWPLRRMI